MMKSLENTPAPLDIQFDSGGQCSFISKSVLLLLPASSYSLGNSSKINPLGLAKVGKVFDTTEVKLNLYNLVLKLVVINTNLKWIWIFISNPAQGEGMHRA